MTIPKLVLSSPADILAAVPYLVGFHPADSLVIAAFAGPELRLTTRWDLPVAPGDLDRLVPLLQRETVNAVVVVGYGPGAVVTPAVDTVTRMLRAGGIRVTECLRADGGRYWSYSCGSVTCCPAEGTPYDTGRSHVAAEAVMHGLVALPDRHSLRQSVQARGGTAMRQATVRVTDDLRSMLAAVCPADGGRQIPVPRGRAPQQPDEGISTAARTAEQTRSGARQAPGAGPPGRIAGPIQGPVRGPAAGGASDELAARFVTEGLTRVRRAIGLYDSKGRLDDEGAARLGLDLAVIRVRDEAWALIDDRDAHVALWRDLTRRLEPRHVAPAASLLAAAAWHRGECALAGMALERALAADPGYSMALLLRQALVHMMSPAMLRDRMPTPAELDDEMGPPRAVWLAPLCALLAEDIRAGRHGEDPVPSEAASPAPGVRAAPSGGGAAPGAGGPPRGGGSTPPGQGTVAGRA